MRTAPQSVNVDERCVIVPFYASLAIIAHHMRRLLVLLPVLLALVATAAVVGANNHLAGSGDSPIIVEPPEDWIGAVVKVTDLPPSRRKTGSGPSSR